MREKIIEILGELRPDVDFAKETDYIENGFLDSFDMVTLVVELNDAFDVEIGVTDIVPENFSSLQSIESLINKLEHE